MTRAEAEAIIAQHGRKVRRNVIVGTTGNETQRVEVGTVWDVAGGILRIGEPPFWEAGTVRWIYDGGAGGVSYGRWESVQDVQDWCAANADAMEVAR